MKRLLLPDEDELRYMYIDEIMSARAIADEYEVSPPVVLMWLKHFDIQIRTSSEALTMRAPGKEELRTLYIDEAMCISDIAREYEVACTTVLRWIHKHDLPINPGKRLHEIPDYDTLCDMYIYQKISTPKISKMFGVSAPTVCDWLRIHGIDIRDKSSRHSGELGGGWKGGISFLPYCKEFNNRVKEAVRKRDDYTCQVCGITENESGRALSVHHVHYDKENCHPDLISLCNRCHSATNSNRDTWEFTFEINLLSRGLLGKKIDIA